MLNFNPELYTYTIDKNGKRRKKYDEADVEKKRIYYLNIVKPKKEKPKKRIWMNFIESIKQRFSNWLIEIPSKLFSYSKYVN